MLSYRILADRCVDIWNSFSPPVFSLDQFHQLTTALERCPLLKSCVEAYPPPFYTKILRLTRQKQPYFQPYVHNALFNGLRTRADRWLNSLSSSHFDQDLVDDGT